MLSTLAQTDEDHLVYGVASALLYPIGKEGAGHEANMTSKYVFCTMHDQLLVMDRGCITHKPKASVLSLVLSILINPIMYYLHLQPTNAQQCDHGKLVEGHVNRNSDSVTPATWCLRLGGTKHAVKREF